MRIVGSIAWVVAVVFAAVFGYLWITKGSLESAGEEVDKSIESVDRSTQPLQDSAKDLGDAVKKGVNDATDGDDRT